MRMAEVISRINRGMRARWTMEIQRKNSARWKTISIMAVGINSITGTGFCTHKIILTNLKKIIRQA
jgi:hypothetical protein